MPEALDPFPLLQALHESGVEYVVVGGFAVNAHGVIRVTKDLDILPNPTEQKEDLGMGGNFCVLTRLGRLDVMQWLSGIDSEDLHSRLLAGAIESELDGIPIRVCGLDDLRAMKRAAGRPQDLEDLRRLAKS